MRILLIILIILPTITYSQVIKLDENTILENKISKITIEFKAIKSHFDYDSLLIAEHHFNDEGLKTYERFVYPYQDVVATTNQTIYDYKNDTILIKKTITQNAVRLTEKDDRFISFFGIDYDTTIIQFDYLVNGLLETEIEYSNTLQDTIKKVYFYNDLKQLIKMIQSNNSHLNELHQDNFIELYYYSTVGLLDSIQHFPSGFNSHSTEFYKYDEDLNLIEKKMVNGFEYMIIANNGKGNNVEIIQNIDIGAIEKNEYENNKLIKTKRGFYSNKTFDLIENYIYNEKSQLLEEYTEDLSSNDRVIIEHQKYKYDKMGLLIVEEIIINKETQFEYLIEYE